MSLYLSHRGAFTHQPLKCLVVQRSWNARRMAQEVCTYVRPWYLPQGWRSDLLEDLNILWARENWICQWSCAFTACLFPGLWYRHVSPSLSMSQDAPTVRWKRTDKVWHPHRVMGETGQERCNTNCVTYLKWTIIWQINLRGLNGNRDVSSSSTSLKFI